MERMHFWQVKLEDREKEGGDKAGLFFKSTECGLVRDEEKGMLPAEESSARFGELDAKKGSPGSWYGCL